MTDDQINKECLAMQGFLEITTSDNIEELFARLTDINIYMARSGYLLAEVKRVRDEQTAQLIITNQEKGYSPSVLNTLVKAQTSDINFYVNWLSRLNAAMVHAGDNIRTQVSYLKQEMVLNRNGY